MCVDSIGEVCSSQPTYGLRDALPNNLISDLVRAQANLVNRGLAFFCMPLAAVGELIARLCQSIRLRDVVEQKSQYLRIAIGAIRNLWVQKNLRPITDKTQIEIQLDAVW